MKNQEQWIYSPTVVSDRAAATIPNEAWVERKFSRFCVSAESRMYLLNAHKAALVRQNTIIRSRIKKCENVIAHSRWSLGRDAMRWAMVPFENVNSGIPWQATFLVGFGVAMAWTTKITNASKDEIETFIAGDWCMYAGLQLHLPSISLFLAERTHGSEARHAIAEQHDVYYPKVRIALGLPALFVWISHQESQHLMIIT